MTSDQTKNIAQHKWSLWTIAAAALLLTMFAIIAVGTLRGCFSTDSDQAADAQQKKKNDETEKPKAQFELDPPIVLPSEPKVAQPPVKPGHWATASQRMKANYRDFVGDTHLSIVDSQNRPYPVTNTPFQIRSSRPVVLSKGRPKATETTFFVPLANKALLSLDLEERGLGSPTPQPADKLTMMPSYQYHFVVLAKTPSRYSYLKTLDSIKVPFSGESEADNTEESTHYLVVELGADQLNALPDNPLTWTSIAYVLWDDIDPGEPFPADQKKALVDWLHWGGQLIVNGPNSLDSLKGSFLDPYLPATNGGPRKLAADDPAIADFNNGWMISSLADPGKPLQPTGPWSAIKLNLRPGANALPHTGGPESALFAERQVGRGRIVLSAIQLTERDFINWRSGFESFFNAALLRRPPRKYFPGYFGSVTLNWRDANLKERRLDAALNTRLKYFARDLGVATSYHHEDLAADPSQPMPQAPTRGRPRSTQPPNPDVPREYRPPDNPGGIGAWNDYSATAVAARAALREAAGVEVPDAGFVVLCLASYLVALVPLNWLLFRTLGRVEWAWVAAPVIAVIGTWVIVGRARLDIGFVRAQTEIGVLEQQPDHPRALLSRYTALYTSLSTTYDFESANMTTLISPFPTDLNAADFERYNNQAVQPVNFQHYDHVRLSGLPISSNSTGMVHSEQINSLDGPIRIATSAATRHEQIENHSTFELHGVCVVKRAGRQLEGRWIGDLMPGQSSTLTLRSVPANKPFAQERVDDARLQRGDQLNIEPLFRLALDPQNIEDGETRLVGRVNEVLSGEAITPTASQVRGATLVVAHLQYAPLPAPEKDSNTRQEIKNSEPTDNNGPIEL